MEDLCYRHQDIISNSISPNTCGVYSRKKYSPATVELTNIH